MVIYIEYLIIDNFLLTYLICDLSYVITVRKRSRIRSLIASAVATASAFAYLFCTDTVGYILKGVLWLVLSLILYVKKQNVFVGALVFLVITMLLGGVLTFFATLATPHHNAISGHVSFSFPIGIIVLIGYVTAFVIKRLTSVINRTRGIEKLIYTVKTGINGKTLELKGFLDTGNRLVDGKSGLPVVIIKASAVIHAFSPAMFAQLIEKGRESNCITYTTVTGGVNRIMLIYPEFFKVEGKKESVDVALGLSFSGFYGDYDLILHPQSV